jgi:CheY-like chemotaxis protein
MNNALENHNGSGTVNEPGRLSILIVDDEKYICELLSELLGENDHRCDAAANGKEALDVLSRKRFDVIVTDVKMPLMDGFTLLKTVKQQYPGIAIVVMTAFGQEYSVREALALGAEEYLPKPFHAEEVLSVVERAYWRNQTRNEAKQTINLENL